jgi:hypothetical protein
VCHAPVTLLSRSQRDISVTDVTLAAQPICDAGVARVVIDRLSGVPGFTEAMIGVGWLVIEDGQAYFPNFERHNGNTAKTRALSSMRQAKRRDAEERRHASVTIMSRSQRDKTVTSVTPMSRSQRDKSVTREEKRREENTNTHTPNPSRKPEEEEERRSAADVCVSEEKFDTPSKDDVAALAEAEALDVDASAWCEYYQARGWLMGKSPMRDWRAAVRAAARAGWCRRPAASAPRKRLDPAAAQIAAEYVRRKQQQAAGSLQAREGP